MSSRVQRRGWNQVQGMFKFAAGVVVGASLTCALASAAQVSRHDGAFWNKLGAPDKTAYVAGYGDAMHTSLGKLDSLKLAASVFHWKGANKLLGQVARELDVSGMTGPALVAYLDGVYANPRYSDFDVTMALGLAAMRGIDGKSSPSVASSAGSDSPGVK
jgi:hypothetical protein